MPFVCIVDPFLAITTHWNVPCRRFQQHFLYGIDERVNRAIYSIVFQNKYGLHVDLPVHMQ